MWVEPTSGRRSDDVLSELWRTGQSETRWYADLVDTRGLEVWKLRHEETGYELEPR